MEIKELLEKITMDMILEGCGLACSLALISTLFFSGSIGYLTEILGMALCG